MSQTITRKDTSNGLGPIRSMRVIKRDHNPHWKRPLPASAHGRACVELVLGDYNNGMQLSIDTEESYQNDEGRKFAKRTIVYLNEEAVRQLYAILRERFNA